MTLEMYDDDTLPDSIRAQLQTQGVDLDDWDYLVIAPREAVHWQGQKRVGTCAADNWLSNVLNGCCSNLWYLIPIDGKHVAVGVAYHA